MSDDVVAANKEASLRSGGTLERAVFNARRAVLLLFALATAFFGYQMTQLRPDAAFEKLIPSKDYHEYVRNFDLFRDDFGAANVVNVIVVNKQGDILEKEYLETLRLVSEEVFFIPGVDRGNMLSLWTPNMRWIALTKDGYRGGVVMPSNFTGTEQDLGDVKRNILNSAAIGRVVADDFRSSNIIAPLVAIDPETGKPLNYGKLGRLLEERIRDKFNSDRIEIRIVGFGKLAGDLIEGAGVIAGFFLIALLVIAALLYLYMRCWRSTALALLCSVVAVVWQLGLSKTLGYGLDPYAILAPFLVFAIGASHAIQMINAVMLQAAEGADRYWAARRAFGGLVAPGGAALVSDAVGFLTLIVIPIIAIKELAVSAGLGVALVFLTNLILLPVLLSYVGVGAKAASRAAEAGRAKPAALWRLVAASSRPKPALAIALIALVLAGASVWKGQELTVGDLDRGAPELHPDSRYNQDVDYFVTHYAATTDVMVVMAATEPGGCARYETLQTIDDLQARLENLPGVQGTFSLATFAKIVQQGTTEKNLRWRALSRHRLIINAAIRVAPPTMKKHDCSMTPVVVFLADHKASTLDSVTGAVKSFVADKESAGVDILLAAGNAGIEAATNEVIAESQPLIFALVYGVVAFLVFIAFRSIRALIAILAPLALTSALGLALMASLGMGVKVGTLPVIALSVGIGVDYGIYVYHKLKLQLDQGFALDEAYLNTVRTTGAAVAFTGVALAAGVATWIFAPTKFQADMGLMLTFMFLWNMLGALTLLPALMRLLGADRETGSAATSAG